MTRPGNPEHGRGHEQSLQAATDDLERIRERLRAAAQGDADSQQVADAVAAYWREHGSALRSAAASLTEELRLQALGELYKWREQLDAQVQRGQGGATTTPPDVDEGTGPAPRSTR